MEMRSPGETDLQNSAQQAGVSDSRRRRRPVGAGGWAAWCAAWCAAWWAGGGWVPCAAPSGAPVGCFERGHSRMLFTPMLSVTLRVQGSLLAWVESR